MTNAGGPAIACADACGAAGLHVEPLQDATRRALREQLPPAAAVAQPRRHARRRGERATSAARSRRSRPTPGSTRSSRSSSRRSRAAGSGGAARGPRGGAAHPRGRARWRPSSWPPARRWATAASRACPSSPPRNTLRVRSGHAARHAHRRRHPPPGPPSRRPAIDADGAAAVHRRALAEGPGWLGVEDTAAAARRLQPSARARRASRPRRMPPGGRPQPSAAMSR